MPGGDKSSGNERNPSDKGRQGESSPAGNPRDNSSGDSKESRQPQGKNGSQQSGTFGDPIGGGGEGETTIPPESLNGPEPGGDDPNLDYARKATELVVQKLKDQLAKGEPDPELLNRLKWSKQDAERFVSRWQSMMQAAKNDDDAGKQARRELDELLRSLGLRPRTTRLEGNRTTTDQHRGLREGLRTAPPGEYADQFRAFTTGAGKNAAGKNAGSKPAPSGTPPAPR